MKSIILHKIIISGGGTGGHIFPSIAIAEEFHTRFPDTDFLFIGAKNKIEMKKVPQAGFPIKGIWISGINRSSIKKNLLFPFKLISSLWNCYQIINKFKPTIAIGTGGFVSGPILWMADLFSVPIFIQEQNSFPGITNKLLSKKAKKIFVAYDSIQKFLPKEKIFLSGNPIRKSLSVNLISNKEAKKQLGLNLNKKCILSLGGSMGSSTINQFWEYNAEKLPLQEVELIWQTGSKDYHRYKKKFINNSIKVIEFITNMSIAYSASNFIISRAGAVTISELCSVGKPSILIPYPFATNDHQNKNAEYIMKKNAAIKILDKNINKELFHELLKLIYDEKKQYQLSKNLKKLEKNNASKKIVDEILKYFLDKN